MPIYLDNASTSSPKSDLVWKAGQEYINGIGASPGRGGYRAARQANQIIEDARQTIASVIGVGDPSNIAFTANATHALNMAIHGFVRSGDHVLTTMIEHNSVLRPLEALSRAGTATYTAVPVHISGRYDIALFQQAARPETRLLVVNHASNVTGVVAPLDELIAFARERNIAVLVDAAQTAGLLPLDAERFGIDMLAFTGHKSLGGPPGTGGLYVREPDLITPLMQGGTGHNSHTLLHPAAMPMKLEAGTVNYLGIAGLGATAVSLLQNKIAIRKTSLELANRCLESLKSMPGITVYASDPQLPRVPVISFNVSGFYPSEICALLDERYGITTRAGLHCAPLIHRILGTSPQGTLRVSFGSSTTAEHVEALCAAVGEIKERGKRLFQ